MIWDGGSQRWLQSLKRGDWTGCNDRLCWSIRYFLSQGVTRICIRLNGARWRACHRDSASNWPLD